MGSYQGTRVAIVTGANKGIGLAVVKALCKEFKGDPNSVVYLTARCKEKGMKAVEECDLLGLKTKFHKLDIGNYDSRKTFAEYLAQVHPHGIDILVNNAGIGFPESQDRTKFLKELKETIDINFTGTHFLSAELFPMLKKHGRAVMVSSSMGYLGLIPFAEIRQKFANPELTFKGLHDLVLEFIQSAGKGNHIEDGWPERDAAYIISKIAVTCSTRIHQREFNKNYPDKDLIVNSVHPGYISTDLNAKQGTADVDYGAKAILYAALLPPNVDKPRGDYVWHDETIMDWVNGPVPRPEVWDVVDALGNGSPAVSPSKRSKSYYHPS